MNSSLFIGRLSILSLHNQMLQEAEWLTGLCSAPAG